MKSLPGARLGSQVPRVALAPSGDSGDGDDAVLLARGLGLVPDAWQELVAVAWLVSAGGRLAASRCGVSAPRQNGKNKILEIVELHKLVVGGRRIMHTAHEVRTARASFLSLRGYFENPAHPYMKKLVKAIRSVNGQESIELRNGGYIQYSARRRSTARGMGFDDLVIDEAQELSDEQFEALRPIISAPPSGQPQILFLGTPPPPRSDGEPFRRIRAQALAGEDSRLAWHEWSPVDVPVEGDKPGLLAAAAESNPAVGLRIAWETVEDELADMSHDGFLRERCGYWGTVAVESAAIDGALWAALARGSATQVGELAWGVKFSADGRVVAAAVAVRDDDGVTNVEALGSAAMPAGASQLIAWLSVRSRWERGRIVVDGRAGAVDFVNALAAAGVPRHLLRHAIVSRDEAIAAHSSFFRAVVDGTVTHLGQAPLDAAVAVAGRRDIGGQGGWGWRSLAPDGDVSDLDAVTLAFGAVQPDRPASRQWRGMVVG